MPSNPIAVKLRLSPSQAQVIAPGLELLTATWRIKQSGYASDTSYPFFFKLPAREKTGIFSQSLMDRVVGLQERVKSKENAEGRTQMDWLEVRIAIFACRVVLDAARRPLSPDQRRVLKSRERRSKNHPQVAKFAKKVARTIQSLERHEKASTRAFRKSVDESEFSARVNEWKSHQQWMRLNLVFFRSYEVIREGHSLAKYFRNNARKLTQIAREALTMEGYDLPPEKDLRHAVGLYLGDSHRVRIPPPYHIDIIRSGGTYKQRVALAQYLLKRLRLKRVRRPVIPTGLPKEAAPIWTSSTALKTPSPQSTAIKEVPATTRRELPPAAVNPAKSGPASKPVIKRRKLVPRPRPRIAPPPLDPEAQRIANEERIKRIQDQLAREFEEKREREKLERAEQWERDMIPKPGDRGHGAPLARLKQWGRTHQG